MRLKLQSYALTAVSYGRRHVFQRDAIAELLIATLFRYRDAGKFQLHAFVVMPDHVHVLLTPAPDVALEKTIQLMKGGFSFRLKSKMDVWERGHFDRRIVDRNAFDACVRYIEQNPVEEGLVSNAPDFAYSSASGKFALDPVPPWFV